MCQKHYRRWMICGSTDERYHTCPKGHALSPDNITVIGKQRHCAVHGMMCHLCRTPILARRDLNIDHVVPLARGGSHTYGNLRPAHKLCNQRKHAKLMSELTL